MGRYQNAIESFKQAILFEPDNENYKEALQSAEHALFMQTKQALSVDQVPPVKTNTFRVTLFKVCMGIQIFLAMVIISFVSMTIVTYVKETRIQQESEKYLLQKSEDHYDFYEQLRKKQMRYNAFADYETFVPPQHNQSHQIANVVFDHHNRLEFGFIGNMNGHDEKLLSFHITDVYTLLHIFQKHRQCVDIGIDLHVPHNDNTLPSFIVPIPQPDDYRLRTVRYIPEGEELLKFSEVGQILYHADVTLKHIVSGYYPVLYQDQSYHSSNYLQCIDNVTSDKIRVEFSTPDAHFEQVNMNGHVGVVVHDVNIVALMEHSGKINLDSSIAYVNRNFEKLQEQFYALKRLKMLQTAYYATCALFTRNQQIYVDNHTKFIENEKKHYQSIYKTTDYKMDSTFLFDKEHNTSFHIFEKHMIVINDSITMEYDKHIEYDILTNQYCYEGYKYTGERNPTCPPRKNDIRTVVKQSFMVNMNGGISFGYNHQRHSATFSRPPTTHYQSYHAPYQTQPSFGATLRSPLWSSQAYSSSSHSSLFDNGLFGTTTSLPPQRSSYPSWTNYVSQTTNKVSSWTNYVLTTMPATSSSWTNYVTKTTNTVSSWTDYVLTTMPATYSSWTNYVSTRPSSELYSSSPLFKAPSISWVEYVLSRGKFKE